MSYIMRSVIAFLCIGSLSLTAAASDGVVSETATDALGNPVVRCVTPGSPNLNRDVALPSNPYDQETIWRTPDLTAIAQNVDMSGNGQSIIVGWWLNSKRTSRYTTLGAGIPGERQLLPPGVILRQRQRHGFVRIPGAT
jgi:hypothetical protein